MLLFMLCAKQVSRWCVASFKVFTVQDALKPKKEGNSSVVLQPEHKSALAFLPPVFARPVKSTQTKNEGKASPGCPCSE